MRALKKLSLIVALAAIAGCGHLPAVDVAAQTVGTVDAIQVSANREFGSYYVQHVKAVRAKQVPPDQKAAELEAFYAVADKVGDALDSLANASQAAKNVISAVVAGQQGESVLPSVLGAVYSAALAVNSACLAAGAKFSFLDQLTALVSAVQK